MADFGIYLTERPQIALDQAIRIAIEAVAAAVPDYRNFILHSVKPRVLKQPGRHAMSWQVTWQQLGASNPRGIQALVDMTDGSMTIEEYA